MNSTNIKILSKEKVKSAGNILKDIIYAIDILENVIVGQIVIFHCKQDDLMYNLFQSNLNKITLDSFIVLEKYRNNGIGKKIIRYVKEQYPDKCLTLMTDENSNKEAYNLYKQEGFLEKYSHGTIKVMAYEKK